MYGARIIFTALQRTTLLMVLADFGKLSAYGRCATVKSAANHKICIM